MAHGEDSALLAAKAASRRDHQQHMQDVNASTQGPSHDLIDLTCDSGDESDIQVIYPKSKSIVSSETETEGYDDHELQRALDMSMETSSHNTMSEEKTTEDVQRLEKLENLVTPGVDHTLPPPPTNQVLPGLDRKKMEEDRLARNAAKRKAPDSELAPAQTVRKILKTDSQTASAAITGLGKASPSLSAKRPLTSSSKPTPDSASNAPAAKVWPTSVPGVQWPLGAVKKTHIARFPRTGDEITIEEVIQRDDLQVAVFSSFLWDTEWLFTKLNTSSTRFVLTMQANDQKTKDEYIRDTAPMPNLRLCFPPIEPQVFCMHSKLMLFLHRDYLRIAVPTANLTPTDWGEDGLMENTVFLIDLPKIETKSPPAEAHTTPFYDDLVYFLKATTLHINLINRLKEFDFSETKRYAFVHSVGGSNTGENWRRTGYAGLGRALQKLGLTSDSPVNIDYVTSSMGSLNAQFLRTIYMACKGDDGLFEYNLRTGPKKDAERQRTLDDLSQAALSHFRVYFPSNKTAWDAHTNPNETGGTICFNPNWWPLPTFPRAVLRDCESERGVLMHNKLAFVSPAKPIDMGGNTECRAWAYVGSANLSESAWGRLVKDTTTKQLKMNCRNWECGVIVPILNEKERTNGQENDETASVSLPAKLFEGTVPVPMRVPAVPLSKDRKPFFFGVDP